MDYQQQLDLSYTALVSGEITRRAYFAQINSLAARHDEIARRFKYRKDVRSLGHFALMLYDNTLRERFLMEKAFPLFSREGESFEDLGINNDGRLVMNPDGKNRRLDFLVKGPDGDYPLEVKYAPTQKFLTYKIDDLTNYLGTPRSKILTVAVLGMVGANGNPDRDAEFELPDWSFFTLMDHDAIGRLIAEGESGRHQGFGGKDTVRIYERKFHRVFQIHSFDGRVANARS